ncbi:polyphosphate glucokinase [Arthrobacter sp. OV608]|nr:polyphosphate glucokinase [Arthrobacter sp. OV608]
MPPPVTEPPLLTSSHRRLSNNRAGCPPPLPCPPLPRTENPLAKKDEKSHKNAPLIGIDIGGTGIKGGIVDLKKGKLLGDRFRVPTPQPATPESVAEAVALVVSELSARPEAPAAGSPVGVTFPGIIQHGVVHSAANVDKAWLNTDIDALLTERLGRPVEVINDADAAGLAEARYGAGAGVSGTVLVITLGTGIGSAFIFNGKLVPNAELGHLEIDGHDAETKASAVARERDGLSWDEYSVLLQRYFSHVEFLFSPELFIVGGGISKRADEYLPNLKLRTPIVPAVLRNEAGIVGAAIEIALKHKLAK